MVLKFGGKVIQYCFTLKSENNVKKPKYIPNCKSLKLRYAKRMAFLSLETV